MRLIVGLSLLALGLTSACGDGGGAAATPVPPTATPTVTATATSSRTATPTSTVTATAAPSAPATESPTASPTSTPTSAPTPPPTATPPQSCEEPGVICTVAGTGMSIFDGDGHPALETSFYFPIDMVFDPSGRPVIIDWNNLRIRRLDDDGTIETIMGVGFEDFPTDGALGKETPLHHPSDIEYDDQGRLYVAGDHVPVVFLLNTDERVYTVAGTVDYGYSGDGGPALEAEMGTPFGVLPTDDGGFYVSDVDFHVVRYVNPDGIIQTIAGTGLQGYSGDGGPATEAKMAGPSRLTIGPDGALYVCETKNHVIRRIDRDGMISTWAGTGSRGYAGDGGPATAAQFDSPYDIHFAPNGDAYVADTGNNVIRRIDGDGIVSTVVGMGDPGFGGDGGDARNCQLKRPSSVVFDKDGSMWLCDTSNHRVRRVWHFLQRVIQ